MKSIKEIETKIDLLKKKLSKKQICENFGEKEQRELDVFIGSPCDYFYEIRCTVANLIEEFNNWCANQEVRK